MNRFEYARPTTVAEAVGLLSEKPDEVAPLAGGTDLLSLLKDFVVEPKRLVALGGIDQLKKSSEVNGVVTLGTGMTIDEFDRDLFKQWMARWPALAQAAAGIKSPQLRAMGTIGGELLQRPRCWYFRHGHGLLARKDGKSMVVAGDHRYHAILGNDGPAKFVSPSSLAPALIALGATATVVGPKGERTLPLADLYRVPKADGESEFTLAANELLKSVTLPAAAHRSATYEVRPRQGLDWPLATASVALAMDGTKVKSAVVVLGHVAPKPWVAEGAAKALAGQELGEKTIAQAAEAAVAGATPLPKNAYKVDLAKVAVRRALAAAAKA
jgi:xanthine dehydrogenase YagS FAD-binding subunit